MEYGRRGREEERTEGDVRSTRRTTFVNDSEDDTGFETRTPVGGSLLSTPRVGEVLFVNLLPVYHGHLSSLPEHLL